MLTDNNLVKYSAACETMGRVSMICCDQAGILTQKTMSLTSIWNQEILNLDTNSYRDNLTNYFPEPFHDYLIQTTVLNGTAMLRPNEKGSKTEIAMLQFFDRCGFDYELIRK